MAFAERLHDAAQQTDSVLDAAVDGLVTNARCPAALADAVRYALLGGGKRFRPFLVIEAAGLFGSDAKAPAAVGAAFECLHAYSLVHDDLPAMDDDDLRRGRPTVHKAYDEATAILVGDGLQALAFELITSPPVPPQLAGRLARLLARASGLSGMVGGQYLDLNAEGFDAADVKLMQSMKTGALIAASCEAGAVVADAGEQDIAAMSRFGDRLGEAFQLADDLLDLEGTAEETGKRVGKDEEEGKATIPQLLGPEEARKRLWTLVGEASGIVSGYGDAGATLREACQFVAERKS